MTQSVDTLVLTHGDWRQGPYGIDRLPQFGFNISGAQPASGVWHRKLRDVLEHRSGMVLDQPGRALTKANSSDLTLGLFEPDSQLAAQLRTNRRPPLRRTPMVMLVCWLTQWLMTADPARRQQLVDTYRGVDLLLTLSANQVPLLVEAGFRPEQLGHIPFGAAPELFDAQADERDLQVLAVGSDAGRDFATLIEAVRGTEIILDLVCSPDVVDGAALPPNVRFHGRVSFSVYRKLLARAQVVAVPTKDLVYPTGQTVALEAALAGSAVVVTETTPMKEYFDSKTAALLPVGDPEAWRHSLNTLLSDDSNRQALAQRGRDLVLEKFTYDHMWSAFAAQLQHHGLPSPQGIEGDDQRLGQGSSQERDGSNRFEKAGQSTKPTRG